MRRMRVALPPAAALARFANERAGAGACCAEDADAAGAGGAPHGRGSLDAAAPCEQGDAERAAGGGAAPEQARPAGVRGAGLLRSLSSRESSPATPSAAVRARALHRTPSVSSKPFGCMLISSSPALERSATPSGRMRYCRGREKAQLCV